jgi:hypothetical protein
MPDFMKIWMMVVEIGEGKFFFFSGMWFVILRIK